MATTVILFFVLLLTTLYLKPRSRRNPPGPKPLPLIGNLLDFPIHYPWLIYDRWKKKYGDIVYMNILGTPIVVLNSLQACNDIFDKRSVKYSSRPRLVMLVELMGWNYNVAMMPYSLRWRKHRRLFHQYFSESASLNYRSIQQQGTYSFIQRIHKEPGRLLDHVRFLFGETMTEIMYGVKVQGPDDTFLEHAEETMKSAMIAAVPGQYLVDVFPLLKYVPAWLPGAGFRRQAQSWKNTGDSTRVMQFLRAKEQFEKGTARPSILTSMLSNLDSEVFKMDAQDNDTPEETISGLAVTAYLAGADTSISTIQSFFLAIANHPQVQQAAQVELDSVLDGSRLPTFEDTADLPFVNAIVKELLRWHNTAPLAIAHYLTEDDEYNGYHLRKGTIVMGNIWSILHDPDVFTDPLEFNPWRWITKTADGFKPNNSLPDPSVVFGYGRRICPGRHFASNALYIVVATVLACFDIRPLNSKQEPVERIEEKFTSGLMTYPEPFDVSITIRSKKVAELLKDIE